MSADPLPENSPQAQRLQRMESSIEQLNARIARLAMALDVSLKTDDDLARVMHRPATPAVAVERRETPDRRTGPRQESGPERRAAYMWIELRGLLVLRYGVEKNFVDQVGVTMTRNILVAAEAHMVRNGFEPGADGIDLKKLFKES